MSSVESATSYDYESHDVSTTLEKVVRTKSLFKGCVNLAQPFALGYEQLALCEISQPLHVDFDQFCTIPTPRQIDFLTQRGDPAWEGKVLQLGPVAAYPFIVAFSRDVSALNALSLLMRRKPRAPS